MGFLICVNQKRRFNLESPSINLIGKILTLQEGINPPILKVEAKILQFSK